MQVVEFDDCGVAGFQHFHIGKGGDGFDVIGREPRQEAVHQLAPSPEAVVDRTSPFGERGHAARESVAM
jgi:hypothetical protein